MRLPLSLATELRQMRTGKIQRVLVGIGLGAALLSACQPSPGPNPAIKVAPNPLAARLESAPGLEGDPNNGRRLFTDSKIYPGNGCGFCHTLPDVSTGAYPGAPNLNDVSLRPTLANDALQNSPAQMKAWIMDPPSQKPDARMPKLNVSDQEATDLVAFIYSQPYNKAR